MTSCITIADALKSKRQRRPIAAVASYDYTTARLVSQTPVEMILTGGSAARMVLGYDSMLPVTMDFMVMITAAVRRGAPGVCLIADMPFLSYHVTIPEAIRNAGRFLTDAGAQMVKMEVPRHTLAPPKPSTTPASRRWPTSGFDRRGSVR